jgi:hypothetical protein
MGLRSASTLLRAVTKKSHMLTCCALMKPWKPKLCHVAEVCCARPVRELGSRLQPSSYNNHLLAYHFSSCGVHASRAIQRPRSPASSSLIRSRTSRPPQADIDFGTYHKLLQDGTGSVFQHVTALSQEWFGVQNPCQLSTALIRQLPLVPAATQADKPCDMPMTSPDSVWRGSAKLC